MELSIKSTVPLRYPLLSKEKTSGREGRQVEVCRCWSVLVNRYVELSPQRSVNRSIFCGCFVWGLRVLRSYWHHERIFPRSYCPFVSQILDVVNKKRKEDGVVWSSITELKFILDIITKPFSIP